MYRHGRNRFPALADDQLHVRAGSFALNVVFTSLHLLAFDRDRLDKAKFALGLVRCKSTRSKQKRRADGEVALMCQFHIPLLFFLPATKARVSRPPLAESSRRCH